MKNTATPTSNTNKKSIIQVHVNCLSSDLTEDERFLLQGFRTASKDLKKYFLWIAEYAIDKKNAVPKRKLHLIKSEQGEIN